jgi:hypothetical protein
VGPGALLYPASTFFILTMPKNCKKTPKRKLNLNQGTAAGLHVSSFLMKSADAEATFSSSGEEHMRNELKLDFFHPTQAYLVTTFNAEYTTVLRHIYYVTSLMNNDSVIQILVLQDVFSNYDAWTKGDLQKI